MREWQTACLIVKQWHGRKITKAYLTHHRINEPYCLSRDAHRVLPRRTHIVFRYTLPIMNKDFLHHHRRVCRNEKPRHLMNRRVEEADALCAAVLIRNVMSCCLDLVNRFARFHDITSDKKRHLRPCIAPLAAWNNRIHRIHHRLCHRIHIRVVQHHPCELDDGINVGIRQRNGIAFLHGQETAVVVEQNTAHRVNAPRKETERIGRYMVVRDGMQSVAIGKTVDPLDGGEIIGQECRTIREIVRLVYLLTFEQLALHIGKVCAEIAQDLIHGVVNLIVREFHLVHVLLFPAHHFFQMLCVNHTLYLLPNTAVRGPVLRQRQDAGQRTFAKGAKTLPDRPRTAPSAPR
nr:MAG TPA: hypothetical protein [Caudoviricetes sp.]